MIGAARKAEIRQRELRIAAAYRAGERQTAIAEREGISKGMVSLALRSQGARLPREQAMARWVVAGRTKAARLKAADTKTKALIGRFFDKVEIGRGLGDCWLWRGGTSTTGYAQLRHNKKTAPASHVALLLTGQPRPGKLYALHECDNPLCVNPAHLWWGTQKENMRDALRKGRMNLEGLSLGLPARLAKCRR